MYDCQGFSRLMKMRFNLCILHQEWQQLERDLLTVEVPVAVYFAYEDKELTEIYKDIETAVTSDQAGSAFEGKKVQMYFQCRNKDQHYP